MCDSHREWIDTAAAQIMQNGEMPSENLMRCREGIADLKCWGLRLMEVIEATPEDEYDDDDDDEQEYDDEYSSELEDFINNLEAQWGMDRRVGRRSVHPVQKLRRWLLSLFG